MQFVEDVRLQVNGAAVADPAKTKTTAHTAITICLIAIAFVRL
jgi:hypothetical protein